MEKIESEEITVTQGEQVFSPVQFNSFRVGPFTYKTIVLPGETREEAFDRAHLYLMTVSRKAYAAERTLFYDRLNGGNMFFDKLEGQKK